MIYRKICGLFILMSLVSSCEQNEPPVCSTGLYGTMFRKTALKDFPVCGEFRLQDDITVSVNGEVRSIGKKYAFENIGEPFESVYYVKGEVVIYRKDSTDYNTSPFNFEYSQLAIPQVNTFENDGVVVQLVFSHDKNNPSHQGPVQYVEWIDWKMGFTKATGTDQVRGSFKSREGTFWIPGPASNSYASLDLHFESQ